MLYIVGSQLLKFLKFVFSFLCIFHNVFSTVVARNIWQKKTSGKEGGRGGRSSPARHNPFARVNKMDIGSEERVHRASVCYESLTTIAKQISVLMQDTKSTQVSRCAKEFHRLFRKNDIC